MLRIFKKNNPTDVRILQAIFDNYYNDFSAYTEKNQTRTSKVYVPIDLKRIAKKLNSDGDVIFGRLYYYLDHKYSYTNEDGKKVYFFAAYEIPKNKHSINFPYLASILADLRDKQKRYRTATTISILSLALAIVSLSISICF